MNPKFYDLPQEKRRRIISAGLEVFGCNVYKNANTEEIAGKAGISKGLLFYYFKNKQELYLYLYDTCIGILREEMRHQPLQPSDDFFEMLAQGARIKAKILARYPYILEFSMRAYYSRNESVSEEIQRKVQADMQMRKGLLAEFLKSVDFSKFRSGVDPQEVLRILVWTTDVYLNERQRMCQSIGVPELMEEYDRWAAIFRKMAYKEEYL